MEKTAAKSGQRGQNGEEEHKERLAELKSWWYSATECLHTPLQPNSNDSGKYKTPLPPFPPFTEGVRTCSSFTDRFIKRCADPCNIRIAQVVLLWSSRREVEGEKQQKKEEKSRW